MRSTTTRNMIPRDCESTRGLLLHVRLRPLVNPVGVIPGWFRQRVMMDW